MKYMEALESKVGKDQPALVQLVRKCLHNLPTERPTTDECLKMLKEKPEVYLGRVGPPRWGKFNCPSCHRYWTSVYSWKGVSKICNNCETFVYPTSLDVVTFSGGKFGTL